MRRMKLQKILSFTISLAILISCIPSLMLTAFAEDTAELADVDVAYYGRAALADLENSTALIYAYDQIVAGVESERSRISVEHANYPLYIDDLRVVWDAYSRDHADHFWVSADENNGLGYTHYSDGRIAEVEPPYTMTGNELAAAKTAFAEAADVILEGIRAEMTDYEKELYLHDSLAARISYTYGTYAHTTYGALVEGEAVCDGYSKALQYLLQRVGIQSFLMLGSSEDPSTGAVVGHAWNLVKIDGEYYQTDLTWDDQDSALYHAYFNQTDAVMRESHLVDDTAYLLPECNAVEAQYFTGKDTYLDTYTATDLGSLMRNGDLEAQVYIPGDVNRFATWFMDSQTIREIAAGAGVQGGFSYGYTQCGRELHLKIRSNFKVTNAGQIYYFANISDALARCDAGSTLRLLTDFSGDMTIRTAIQLDLNGFDIDGDLEADAVVTVCDSETDDYTVLNGNGYGKITGVVSGARPEEGYLSVQENDGLSFHRVNVALENVGIRIRTVGLYYTGTYAYDEVVARNLSACGVTLSTVNPEPIVDAEDTTCVYTRSPKTLLTEVMREGDSDVVNRANARKLVYGRAYLMLQDGTCIYSQSHGARLQTVVETIDRSAWGTLTKTQKDWLKDMYDTYSGVMEKWDVENLKVYSK